MTNKPTYTFGPVVVLSKRDNTSGNTVAVKLGQRVETVYPPGHRQHLALQETLTHVDKPQIVTSHRKATQRLLPAEAAKLSIGDEIGGHLVRTLRSTPRYAGQKAAYEGGYASSTWSPTYQEDVDLRE